MIGDFGVFTAGRLVRLPAHPLGPHLHPERSSAQAQGEHTGCEDRHHYDAFRSSQYQPRQVQREAESQDEKTNAFLRE
jgi:hypothetical protein